MLFNSFTFAVFFVIVYGLYTLFRKRYKIQNLLLLTASYVFYGWWDVRFLFLIVISTVIDYVCTIMIDKGQIPLKRRIKAAVFFLGSLFFCIIVKWDAVNISVWQRKLEVDWNQLLRLTAWDIRIVWISAAGLIVFWVLYPLLRRLDRVVIRKLFITLSIVLNLTILGFFKYFNFFAENLVVLTENLFNYTPGFATLHVVLPVGISFFTFQTMSHTIDVYRRKMDSTISLVELSVYVAFFPQLVAGPIERGEHLLPQFQRPRKVDSGQFREGMWLIFWGLYKKIVIADNIAQVVNTAFGPYDKLDFSVMSTNGVYLLFAVYAFAIQIYCDFSGYTDIARGAARLMGFDIMLNFNLPYFSKSPSEFWQRWHISLSSWLRDYLYIPMGGNRKGSYRTIQNLMVTMLLGGLWHGAAWTFVIWGAFHGFILAVYRLASVPFKGRQSTPLRSVLKVVVMFHLVCLGWLLFRAQNIETVHLFARNIITDFKWSTEATDCMKKIFFYGWFLAGFQCIQYFSDDLNPMKRWHWFIRLNVWIFVLMSIVSLSAKSGQEFIYFAF